MTLPARYTVVEELPERVFARDDVEGRDVVIKELTLGRLSDWKELELFERETALLRQLDHPSIPQMLDAFEGEGQTPSYYLVCARAAGTPLPRLDELDAGRLLQIARRVLEVLKYLQSFSPPVVHRNITPEAILVDGDDVHLIDFGSVQVELHATVGGSTMVGTSGYMAPEQLLGRATPASDLYALGAVLVEMLTGVEPAGLPVERMKLRWRNRAKFGDAKLHAWVDRLIEPDVADRFETAEDALRALGAEGNPGAPILASSAMLASRPAGTDITLKRHARMLEIQLPPRSSFRVQHKALAIVAVLSIAAGLFSQATAATALLIATGVGFALLLLVSVVMFRRTHGAAELKLDVDRGYRVRGPEGDFSAGTFRDVVSAETGFRGLRDSLWLATTDRMLQVGRGLSGEESAWLRDEIAAFVAEHRR